MADEKILIEVEVDNDQAIKDINAQNAAIDRLQKENKELAAQGKKNSQQYQQNAAQIQKLNAARRQNVKLISSEKGSLNELRANLARLTTQRNAVNTSTKAGAAEFKRLNREILKQNTSIKAAEQAGGDFRRNVGNYGQALSQVNPALGSAASGFNAMRTAAMAFIATPIGAVIAAIGAAIGALTQYFRDNEEGQNRLTKITNRLSAIFGVLTDAVSDFGKFLFEAFDNPLDTFMSFGKAIEEYVVNQFKLVVDGLGLIGKSISLLFEGEFTEAAKTASQGLKKVFIDTNPVIQATNKLGDAIKYVSEESEKRVGVADRLSAIQAQIDKDERKLLVDRANAQREIADLRLKAKKEDQFTAQERIAFLEEAKQLTDEIAAQEENLAQQRYDSRVLENSLSNSSKEDLKEEAQLQADLINVQTARANANRKLETEIQTNKKKVQAEEQALRNQEQADRDAEVQAEKDKAAELQKIRDKELSDKKKKAEQEKKFRQQVANASISLASNVFKGVSQFLEQGSKEQKAFAIADATINTAKGITNAMAYGVPPLNFVNAAAVGVAGAAQIASIVSTNPSSSGSSGGSSIAPPTAQQTTQQQINTNQIDQQVAQQQALIEATNNIGMSVSVTEINDVNNRVRVAEETSSI